MNDKFDEPRPRICRLASGGHLHRVVCLFWPLLLGPQPSTALAQDAVVTYQGRVTDSGTNFTGPGQFKFGIVTSTNNNHTATATANVSGGFVTTYEVPFGGNGYSIAPAVTISGGGGLGATAHATVSGGVVTSIKGDSSGSGYTSPPTVTIAPPPEDITYTTYWSNDGTSSAGSEPANALSVSVANGLFTVPLGDTTLANMTALNAALFTQPNLQLRIWFNDGVSGFAALSPVLNLTCAPYAALSQSASNLLGSLPAAQIRGAVSLANLPTTLLVTNGQTGVNLTGTFSGNGAGVTNVPIGTLNAPAIIIWPGNFVLASSPGVGSSPSSVAAADVNGDGKVDLICANHDGGTLTVLTNDGSGGFVIASSPSAGSAPQSVTAADVNGDGKVDLICANYGGGRLTVLTNDGRGGFVLASSPGVGSSPYSPYSVTAADVNGDGKVDLISANYGDNTLTVLTNNGSGGFALASSPGVGSGPVAVTAADVNGDAKVDLICANHDGGTLTVLTNDGSGGFVLASSPGVGSGPGQQY